MTREERLFRGWMLISAAMYAAAVPIFLFGANPILRVINGISAFLLPLPLYPLLEGGEGAFWRVLSVSMMVMLTWAAAHIANDVRRCAFLTPIILCSKACSTGLYLLLFLRTPYFAYFVGVLTDGPIFVATFVLWYLASPGPDLLDSRERSILNALGDAFIPRGGAIATGYADHADSCMADTLRLVAAQDVITRMGTRLMLRLVNAAPILFLFRPTTFLGMYPEDRAPMLARLEHHWFFGARMLVLGVKVFVVVPFFNQTEAARAVGYDPEEAMQP